MNFIYDKFAEAVLSGQIAWKGNTNPDFDGGFHCKAQLVDTALYTPDPAHAYLDAIPEAARVGYSVGLTGLEPTDGYLYSNPATFIGLELDEPIEGLVIYSATGVAGTSRLVVWCDTGIGLPVTPGGRDTEVSWPSRRVALI